MASNVTCSQALRRAEYLCNPSLNNQTAISIDILLGFFSDTDARVRRCAIRYFGRHQQSMSDSEVQNLWPILRHTLLDKDPEDQVRLAALRVIQIFAQRFPHIRVQEGKLRLVDDSFEAVCERINDTCLAIRKEASRALGALPQVSNEQLLSALSKDASNVSFRAAGAFVHGLEDECEAVRISTIRSIFQQAIWSSLQFAQSATPFIIDAFADESNKVRLLAVRTLHGICLVHQISLGLQVESSSDKSNGKNQQHESDYLEWTLGMLEDRTGGLAEAVCELLRVARLADSTSLLKTIEAVVEASRSEDQPTNHCGKISNQIAMITLAHLARKNAQLVYELLKSKSLLQFERFYLIVEPRVEDHLHSARMIVALNALQVCPEIDKFLPAYVYKQFHYYRLRFPEATQEIKNDQQLSRLFSLQTSADVSIDKDRVKLMYRRLFMSAQNHIALSTLKLNLAALKTIQASKHLQAHLLLLERLVDYAMTTELEKANFIRCTVSPLPPLVEQFLEGQTVFDENTIDDAIDRSQPSILSARNLSCIESSRGLRPEEPIKVLEAFPLCLKMSVSVRGRVPAGKELQLILASSYSTVSTPLIPVTEIESEDGEELEYCGKLRVQSAPSLSGLEKVNISVVVASIGEKVPLTSLQLFLNFEN